MEKIKKFLIIFFIVATIFILFMTNDGFAKPVKKYIVTSRYGPRGNIFHYGIDLVSLDGDLNIYSPANGIVTFAGWAGNAGNMVVLKANEYEFQFMHLQQIFVQINEKIKKDQKIGIMGTTGYSTGVHLHFGIKKNGNYINPDDIFKF